MIRLVSLGGLLIAGLMLGALPARAEYMRDEIRTFERYGSSDRVSERRSLRTPSRATRQTARSRRGARRVAVARPRTAVRRAAPRPVESALNFFGSTVSGMASYYWQGQRTASGARFNPSAMTAAHKTLPFGTRVRVTSQSTGRSVVVTINDRGPFVRGRIIDLSRGAASVIGMTGAGVARVSLAVLGR
jgi:rare lipoprotein A